MLSVADCGMGGPGLVQVLDLGEGVLRGDHPGWGLLSWHGRAPRPRREKSGDGASRRPARGGAGLESAPIAPNLPFSPAKAIIRAAARARATTGRARGAAVCWGVGAAAMAIGGEIKGAGEDRFKRQCESIRAK